MDISVQTITPARAAEMLTLNTHNRPMSPMLVKRLAQEMERGHWQMNGDAIRFNCKRLLDGQHRLAAVVESGVTIQSVVVEGLPDDVFRTIDTGKTRSAADAFALNGEINPRNLQATLKWIDRYRTGKVTPGNVNYSVSDALELLKAYPAARRSVQVCKNQGRRFITPSVMAACHFLFAEIDEDAANSFVHRLATGVDLPVNHPIYQLRERLLSNASSKAKISAHYIFAITIRAWNLHRASQTINNLRWRESGPTAEPFPTVQA